MHQLAHHFGAQLDQQILEELEGVAFIFVQ
jgi:hypothetical protein